MAVPERKRPWYLVLALFGALALGAAGAFQGWATFVTYHDPVDVSGVGRDIADEADRTAVVTRVQAYIQTLDAAKNRAWPLGVATLLLGSAVFVFAMRALGGNNGARVALVQLAIAQAGANAASYWLLRDVFEADLRVHEAEDAAESHDRVPERDRAEVLRAAAKMRRAGYPIAIALDTLSSALIVFGLTRRRSREFFDAAGKALRERER
jgi:hypothetical protein